MTDLPNTAAIKALCKAQAAMPKAVKDSNNPHFNKKYESLAAVQDASLPHLHANGFAVLAPTGRDEDGLYLETILAHESGGQFTCRIPLMVDKQNMQGFKSAVTYARRIGLGCLSGVAPEDDDGNKAADNPPKNERRQSRKEPPQDDRPPPREERPDYDPIAQRDELLRTLDETHDDELAAWKTHNKTARDLLGKEAPAEFKKVAAACRDRAAAMAKQGKPGDDVDSAPEDERADEIPY